MNWIDTAEVYGRGRSEELVARAVEGRRDEVLVFTKVAPDDEGSGIRPEEIRKAVQGSLSRLRTDRIDLYQAHWPDDRIPVEETWGTMAELVGEGLVRFIGLSNFDRERIERCLPIHPVTSVQNEFSLLNRRDRSALLPWLVERGIGYLAYGPLRFGLLTGAIGPDTTFQEGDWRGAASRLQGRGGGPVLPGELRAEPGVGGAHPPDRRAARHVPRHAGPPLGPGAARRDGDDRREPERRSCAVQRGGGERPARAEHAGGDGGDVRRIESRREPVSTTLA